MAPLSVAIIGAGPGGLTAALALRNAGHKVDVFERSSLTRQGGFRLALGSNALNALASVGVTFDSIHAARINNEVFHEGRTAKWMKTENFEYVEPRYGTPWATCERTDVQKEQIRQAGLTPPGMQQINIHLKSEVLEVKMAEKSILLKDGTIHRADLIIIANGVHSKHAAHLVDGDIPPLQYSRTAYRVTVPMEKMRQDKEVWDYWGDHLKDVVTFGIWDQKTLLMSGGNWSRDSFGGLLMSPSMKAVDGSDADYNLVLAPDAAVKYVKDFHPVVQRWVFMSEYTTVWTSVYRESLTSIVKDCTIGIGDAVHAHLPHHGQGASSAIEDGLSLAPFLDASDTTLTPETLASRLQAWENFRKPWARCVHMLSIRWPAPLDQLLPEIREVYDGPLPPHNKDHTEVMWDFLFGYDVLKEAKEAAKKMREENVESMTV